MTATPHHIAYCANIIERNNNVFEQVWVHLINEIFGEPNMAEKLLRLFEKLGCDL